MAKTVLTCAGCGTQFLRPKPIGQIPKFCGTRCRDRHRRRESTDHRLEIERRANRKRRQKAGFHTHSNALTSLRLKLRYQQSNPVRVCDVCGVEFCNVFGRLSWATSCSQDCSAEKARRNAVRKEKVRKLRKRGVLCEIVDPHKVFERDRWRCQLCGVVTPKRLRGTFDPRAPELDHIIPLAAGGEHSYRNTQCACRSCNRAKGAKPLGQLRLIA
jgi:5-methylcytosine-specific restriction endonuclease McrA